MSFENPKQTPDQLDTLIPNADPRLIADIRRRLNEKGIRDLSTTGKAILIEFIGHDIHLLDLNHIVALTTPPEESPFFQIFQTRFMSMHNIVIEDRNPPLNIQELYRIVKDEHLTDVQKLSALKENHLSIPQGKETDMLGYLLLLAHRKDTMSARDTTTIRQAITAHNTNSEYESQGVPNWYLLSRAFASGSMYIEMKNGSPWVRWGTGTNIELAKFLEREVAKMPPESIHSTDISSRIQELSTLDFTQPKNQRKMSEFLGDMNIHTLRAQGIMNTTSHVQASNPLLHPATTIDLSSISGDIKRESTRLYDLHTDPSLDDTARTLIQDRITQVEQLEKLSKHIEGFQSSTNISPEIHHMIGEFDGVHGTNYASQIQHLNDGLRTKAITPHVYTTEINTIKSTLGLEFDTFLHTKMETAVRTFRSQGLPITIENLPVIQLDRDLKQAVADLERLKTTFTPDPSTGIVGYEANKLSLEAKARNGSIPIKEYNDSLMQLSEQYNTKAQDISDDLLKKHKNLDKKILQSVIPLGASRTGLRGGFIKLLENASIVANKKGTRVLGVGGGIVGGIALLMHHEEMTKNDWKDMGWGMVPVIGGAHDLYRAWQGTDLEGRTMSATERAMRVGFGIIGLVPGLGTLVKLGAKGTAQVVKTATKGAKIASKIENANIVNKTVSTLNTATHVVQPLGQIGGAVAGGYVAMEVASSLISSK